MNSSPLLYRDKFLRFHRKSSYERIISSIKMRKSSLTIFCNTNSISSRSCISMLCSQSRNSPSSIRIMISISPIYRKIILLRGTERKFKDSISRRNFSGINIDNKIISSRSMSTKDSQEAE